MNFNTLEMIGLAFICGTKVAEAVEEIKNKDKEETDKKEQPKKEVTQTVEIKKISREEMANIFDTLKRKVLGGNE